MQVIAACLRLRSIREPAVQFDKDTVFQTDDIFECVVKAEVQKAGRRRGRRNKRDPKELRGRRGWGEGRALCETSERRRLYLWK